MDAKRSRKAWASSTARSREAGADSENPPGFPRNPAAFRPRPDPHPDPRRPRPPRFGPVIPRPWRHLCASPPTGPPPREPAPSKPDITTSFVMGLGASSGAVMVPCASSSSLATKSRTIMSICPYNRYEICLVKCVAEFCFKVAAVRLKPSCKPAAELETNGRARRNPPGMGTARIGRCHSRRSAQHGLAI